MDDKREDVLISAGLKRVEAKILLYLFEHNETVSRSIEREMQLRQPEVSNAMVSLSKRGWISKKQKAKTGYKGRPETIFTIVKKKASMMEDIKERLRKKGIQIKETLEELDKF